MLIIFGSRGLCFDEDVVYYECLFCDKPYLKVISHRRYGTLFFIPIVPLGRKEYYLECSYCKNSYRVKEMAEMPIDDFVMKYSRQPSVQ